MRDTIKNHKDFLVAEDAPSARSAYFLIRMRPTLFESGRFGLIATKRSFRHAVDRNRAKRLLRDWIAFNEHLMRPDMDYIFIARRMILPNTTRAEGRVAMKKALHYLKRLKTTDEKSC